MLSRTAVHALKAVAALAELPPHTYAGAADLAGEIDAPPNYLSKLLRTLADSGLLESQKGKGGGFRLAKGPQRISMFAVVEPIDHVSRWTGCFMGRPVCSNRKPCTVHHRWGAIRDDYLQFLRETSIAQLADLA
ncbi:MAG: RrF2 family transcriptional regulator [Pirellulaceae bacterium]